MKPLARLLLCGAALCLSACKEPASDSLVVTDEVGYAPLSRPAPGVAYFTLGNNTAAPVLVRSFSSNCFSRAELHSSVMENGIATMKSIDSISVAPGRTLRLSPGGLHLMLSDATTDVTPGSRCRVTINFENEPGLTFELELLDRKQYQPAEPVK